MSLLEHCRDVDGFTLGAMSLGSCEGEESVDDPCEPGALLERGVAGGADGGGVFGVEVLEPQTQCGEWGAELMAGVGDEAALRGDELVEPGRHFVEGVCERDDLGRAGR